MELGGGTRVTLAYLPTALSLSAPICPKQPFSSLCSSANPAPSFRFQEPQFTPTNQPLGRILSGDMWTCVSDSKVQRNVTVLHSSAMASWHPPGCGIPFGSES